MLRNSTLSIFSPLVLRLELRINLWISPYSILMFSSIDSSINTIDIELDENELVSCMSIFLLKRKFSSSFFLLPITASASFNFALSVSEIPFFREYDSISSMFE